MGDSMDDYVNDRGETIDKGPVWFKSQRYILAYMLSTGLVILFLLRYNFGIVLICMVNHTAVDIHQTYDFGHNNQHLNSYDYLSVLNTTPSSKDVQVDNNVTKDVKMSDSCDASLVPETEKEDGPLVWDKQTQGLLLGALFWSYGAVVLPGNHVLRKVSRKRLTAITMAITSLLSILAHGAALWNPWAMFAIKLGQGAVSALCYIALYGMWTDWAPPQERSGLITLCFSGIAVSNVVVFPMSAMLCKYGFLGGWPSVFYVYGIIGFAWTLLFMLLTSDSPASHPRISDKERHYIQSSLAGRPKTTSSKVPWLAILRSPAVWGSLSSKISNAWGYFLFVSTLPQYMKEILNFDIRENGLYSTFPYLAMLVFSLLSGQVADILHRRKLLSLLSIQKIATVLANIVPAILLCILSYLDCSQWALAVGLLTLAFGFSGFGYSVFPVNPYNIAPRFASAITALGSVSSCIPGVVAPYMVNALTKEGTRSGWQIVMFVTAGVFVVGTIGFCLLGQTDVQAWAEPESRNQPLIGQCDQRDGATTIRGEEMENGV